MSVLEEFLGKVVTEIINPIILLLSTGAFIVLVWGIVKFVWAAGDEKARLAGRQSILWGLVGLVVIFGAYGIINVAANTFNLPNITPINGR